MEDISTKSENRNFSLNGSAKSISVRVTSWGKCKRDCTGVYTLNVLEVGHFGGLLLLRHPAFNFSPRACYRRGSNIGKDRMQPYNPQGRTPYQQQMPQQMPQRQVQQPAPKHICFYSNKDDWSKAFIQELKETPWVREFKFVCADDPQVRPRWLKQVPTLVVEGGNEPLVGSDVMNWLYERKLKEGPKQQQTNNQSPVVSGDAMAWNPKEMSGYANCGYSPIDADTTAQGDGGMLIPGAFTFLNGSATPGDRQSQQNVSGMSQSTGRSKKEQQFDAQMEMYMQQRSMGMPQQRRPV